MRKALLGLTIAAALLTAQTAHSRSGSWMGPRTNAPGENNCTSCHSGTANTPPGSVWITAPGQYVPNDTVTLFASVESAGKVRWGFEITALNSSNQPVGQMVISDAVNTRISTDGGTGRQYMFHTSTGTYNGTADSSLGWTFKWAAPGPGVGAVTFYMSGLAADGAGGNSGDKCFTTSTALTESIVSDVDDNATVPAHFVLDQNYPNPFNPQTALSYQLPRPAEVQIAIYNVLGGQVRLLAEGYQSAGRHTRIWNGTDDRGRAVAAGVYFYRLTAGDHVALRKMLLLK